MGVTNSGPSRLPATTSQIRLRLQPLDVAGAARMVSSMLGGQEVSAEVARFLHQHTDGVPLAEAAFLGRSSYLSAIAARFDGFFDTQ